MGRNTKPKQEEICKGANISHFQKNLVLITSLRRGTFSDSLYTVVRDLDRDQCDETALF